MELILNNGKKVIVNKAEIIGSFGNGTMMVKCLESNVNHIVTSDSFYNRKGTN
jgi:hypothetical protein